VLIEDDPAAKDFLAFVGSEQGRAVFREFGYKVP